MAGWIGGLMWGAALSMVFLVQGKFAQGLAGVGLTAGAIAAIVFFAPWRFSQTLYWKLMLAPYGAFLLSIGWVVWSFGGLGCAGLTWWNLLWLLPLLMPIGTLHKKRWVDTVARQDAPADEAEPHA